MMDMQTRLREEAIQRDVTTKPYLTDDDVADAVGEPVY